jgi:N-sulfoglucosamine sulfohydrolase
LYDLASDPHEVTNLADNPMFEKQLADLQLKLREFQHRTGDPWELKWERE